MSNHGETRRASSSKTEMSTRVYVGRISHRARDRDVERLFRNYGKIREIVFKNGYGFVEFDDHRDADDAVYELNGKDLCGERIIVEHARGTARGKDKFTGGSGDRGGSDRDRGGSDRDRGGSDRDRGGSDRDRGGGRSNDDYGRRSSTSSRAPSWLDNNGSGSRYGPPTRTEYRLVVENLSSRVSWQDLKDYMRQAGEVTYADAHKDRKNEGVVEFASYSDMKTALDKLDGTDINGRRIKLVEDKPKKRSPSRSRSRSRSKSVQSRSRSRSPRRSRSKERSRSASKSRSPSRSPPVAANRAKCASRSPSHNKSRSRSGSRAKSASRSKSRSHSASLPAKENGNGEADDK